MTKRARNRQRISVYEDEAAIVFKGDGSVHLYMNTDADDPDMVSDADAAAAVIAFVLTQEDLMMVGQNRFKNLYDKKLQESEDN